MRRVTHTPILAIAADKGGVGKTTTAINTAAYLAAKRRVLLVDADHQVNATRCFLREPPEHTLLDCLLDESVPLPRVNVKPSLDLVAASTKMFGVGITLMARMADRKQTIPDLFGIIHRILSPVIGEYDIVIIDCPPSDNLLAINALCCATHVLIPTKPEPFCIMGVNAYIHAIRTMNGNSGTALQLAGILITDYETGSAGHAKVEKSLREWAKDFVFQTRIRHSRPIYNASLAQQDIFSYFPDSNGAKDYENYIHELMKRLKINE